MWKADRRRRYRQSETYAESESIDKHAIGRRREIEIADHLVQVGIIDGYWQPPRARYAAQDVFGLFDLIAYKHEWPLILIQVKRARFNDQRQEIARFAQEHAPAAHFWSVTYDTTKKGSLRWIKLDVLGWNDGRWYEAARMTQL